ncbi:hypothetical protein [Salinigranum salinum]|uniref:hypothetical protein n=1 Tax=Salinigranum salinum TaxID=1364937 RepID=UPI001260463F|nr:hypothetical protein [Salinigranum salinum]
MTEDELADRIERIAAAYERPPDESDLPEGYDDPIVYLTDEDGNWSDLRYARLLLEARGPSGPAWVALRELEELERELDSLETRFLRFWRFADREWQTDDEYESLQREAESVADQIAAEGYLDRRLIDSIRAQLVILGELEKAHSDSEP